MNLNETIRRLAERYDSFYVYDEQHIIGSIQELTSHFPQVKFLYSLKCNPHPDVLRSVFSQGLGADAASLGEVRAAASAGLPKEAIYFSAPGKTQRDIEQALSSATIIADSIGEIQRLQQAADQAGIVASIGLRINPRFSFYDRAGHPSKFGIDEDLALDFIRSGSCPNVKIIGIHVHLKSQELQANVLASYYANVLALAETFSQLCGEPAFLNMGSGLGIPYSKTDAPLDLAALSRLLGQQLQAFQSRHRRTKILIETGRYVVGKSGLYVTKVLDCKQSYGKKYVIVKNTLNGFIRPSLAHVIKSYAGKQELTGTEPLFTSADAFQILPLQKDGPLEKVTVVGNLCTAADVLAEDIWLPPLTCGDLLVVTNAGSYAAVLSPMQFSSQEQPAECFLTADGAVHVRS